jgi:uncharacterized delta-60 repeat protein
MKHLFVFLVLLYCANTAGAQVSVKHSRINATQLGKSLFIRQPDGKFIYFTSTGGNFYSGRLFANGDNDDAYAGARTSKKELADLISCKTQAIVIDKWNRIIVVGSSKPDSNSARAATMARFTRNGDPDADFVPGVVQLKVGDSSELNGAYLLPDEKIMGVGSCFSENAWHFFFCRFQYNGVVDTTYGNGGSIIDNSMPGNNKVVGTVVQPDGKVIVAGRSYVGDASDMVLARYAADGSKDIEFGIGGTAMLKGNSTGDLRPLKIAMQADGKTIVAGTCSDGTGGTDFFVARFSAWGLPDSSFSKTGFVKQSITYEDRLDDLLLLPDGRLILSGAGNAKGEKNYTRDILLRYSIDGIRDEHYGYGLGDKNSNSSYFVKQGYRVLAHNVVLSEREWKIYKLSELASDNETETLLTLNTFLLDTALGVIDIPNRKQQSSIYPVPVAGAISFSFDLIDEAKITVKLTDQAGKEISTIMNNAPYTDGEHSLAVTLPATLKRGYYQLQITTADGYMQTIELVKYP